MGRLILRMNAKTPVLPVYIHGTAEALSRGSAKPKFGSYISITFGKPIYYNEYADTEWDTNSKSFYDTARVITNDIMKNIQDLCYDTEKGLFQLLEKKFDSSVDKIQLSKTQSKKLSRWLRKYSHVAPYELESFINS